MHELVIIVAQYVIILPVIAYLGLVYYQRRQLKELLLFSFISAVFALILIKVGAALHSDPRPFIRDGVTPYFKGSNDNGFPSDHTALSSLVAFIVFRYNKPAGIALFLIALAIGAARVIGGVHHGQDIVGAMAMTLVSVYAATFVTRWLVKTHAQRTSKRTADE